MGTITAVDRELLNDLITTKNTLSTTPNQGYCERSLDMLIDHFLDILESDNTDKWAGALKPLLCVTTLCRMIQALEND